MHYCPPGLPKTAWHAEFCILPGCLRLRGRVLLQAESIPMKLFKPLRVLRREGVFPSANHLKSKKIPSRTEPEEMSFVWKERLARCFRGLSLLWTLLLARRFVAVVGEACHLRFPPRVAAKVWSAWCGRDRRERREPFRKPRQFDP